MRLLVILLLLGSVGCAIFEPARSPNGDRDTGDDSSTTLDVADIRNTEDSGVDAVATLDVATDSARDVAPDMPIDPCGVCEPDQACFEGACRALNGTTCVSDDECVAVCTQNRCAPRRAMWVWTPVAADSIATTAVIDYALQKGVRTIFLESEALIYDADPANGLSQANLAAFIAVANNAEIDVYLLFGYAEWARPANHAEIVALIERAETFATTAAAKPTGIVVDIEPHALADWGTDTINLANGFLDMLTQVVAATTLPLYATIPFWYDTVDIERDQVERPLHEWVIDIASGATVMNYRDIVATSDGLAAHGADELNYASSVGKPVIMNVETQCGLLDKTTFCEEGEQGMEDALSEWIQNEAANPSFVGLGIHDYTSYSALP